jgi:hypothetical protein
MTCDLPQQQGALKYFPLVQEACRKVDLVCDLDAISLADNADLNYAAYTKSGKKVPLRIGNKFRLTVLCEGTKSYAEKLHILIGRLRTELERESPFIML